MKLIIVLAAVTLAQAAKLDKTYLPPTARSSGGSANFLQAPLDSGFQAQSVNAYTGDAFAQSAYARNAYARSERPQAALERSAAILRQDNSNDGETYSYAYETENGIYAEENGVATNGARAQGGFTYTGDDGKIYSIRYTADENGFVPQGDHLPTPPPIPEEILKSLEQNARDEAAGIYDDGSYNAGKYADNAQRYYNNAQPATYSADDAVVTNAAVFNNAVNVGKLEKAYLPPFAQRRTAAVARQLFNSKDGYRY